MTTDETRPETMGGFNTDAPDNGAPGADANLLPLEPDDTSDPETIAHDDPDLETIAHARDVDDEAFAGHLQDDRLDGQEDGRLLD